MPKQQTWRVRVRKVVEDWLDVEASSAKEAEVIAATRPNVVSVFGGSAFKGDKLASDPVPFGIQEELFK